MSKFVIGQFYSVRGVGLAVALPFVIHTPLALGIEPVSSTPPPTVYHFTIDVTAGSLTGMSFDGSFCYDAAGVSGEGTEIIGVDEGLKTSVLFFGEVYTEADDSNYPEFPQLTFTDGEVEQLDFWIEPGDRLMWWDLPGWDVTLTPTAAGTECPVEGTEPNSTETIPPEVPSPEVTPAEVIPSEDALDLSENWGGVAAARVLHPNFRTTLLPENGIRDNSVKP
ncbi:MAG: hypothetical protein VKJ64_07040 [Leptolyngbyaceae bacterium]|nr:hypothetical protein [Leptolyngbyaceae bacterium]